MTLINRRTARENTAKAIDTDPGQTSTTEIDHAIACRDVPEEVTKAPLEIYSDDALAARLLHYEREALLERDSGVRAAWKAEVSRTRNEITRRRAAALANAERVFK